MPNKHVLIAIAILALVAAATARPWPLPVEDGSAAVRLQPVTTAFRPSEHGFAFRNPPPLPEDPLISRLTSGRCGGMSYGALDHYAYGSPPVASDADGYLMDRSVDSIVANGPRFVFWSLWPIRSESPLVASLGELTRQEELPKLITALKSGPVPLGLVRAKGVREIRRNHQVVAYAVDFKGDMVLVSVYDSSHPGADDITLEFPLSDSSAQIDEYAGDWRVAVWRGFFVEHYSPKAPPSR
jgi:hypothetical protein